MSDSSSKRRELPAVKFTKAAIDRLPLPASGRDEYRDEKTPALRLRITANGKRTFSYYGRVKGGRVERITIGPYPMGVTVDQARDQARAFGEQMAAGRSPDVPRHNSTAPTFSDFLGLFLATKRNKRGHPLAARTQSEYRATADRYLGRFLKYRLHELKREHVAQLHAGLGATAPFAANRLLAMLSSVYHFAKNERGLDVANPTTGIRKFAEDERDRVLDPAELERLWRALDQEESDFGIVFKLALLTGARRSNVLAMRWDDVDLTAREWRMRQKGDRLHVVPLVPQAAALLKARKRDKSGWVFPADSASGHLAEPKKAWAQVCARAKLKNARIHDLRRTMGTELAASGATMAVAMAALGHSTTRSALVYQRIAQRQNAVRGALNAAVGKMTRYRRQRGGE